MQLQHIVIFVFFSVINAEVVKLSCKQIKEFVDGHNKHRLQLAQGLVEGQPGATNMNTMVWDEELAEKSAKWASKNLFKHNQDRYIPSGRFVTGENIHWSGTFRKDPMPLQNQIKRAMDSWFKEHQDYTYQTFEASHGGPMIGHYTQMIWADTKFVGCAISHQKKNGKYKHENIIVCNYGPAGNMLGRKPYNAGNSSKNLICEDDHCKYLYGEKC